MFGMSKLRPAMSGAQLYDEFIRRLLAVNDETITEKEHWRLGADLRAWRDGVTNATGYFFNGDYYYIDLIDAGKAQYDRPMCCGVFCDWKHRPADEWPDIPAPKPITTPLAKFDLDKWDADYAAGKYDEIETKESD